MLKKILMSIAIMGTILLFTQCTDRPITPDKENPALKAGKGNGNGPGGGSGNGSGKGKGNGGLNSGNGGGGGIYGDLTICLRNANGVPLYLPVDDAEKGETTYYARPIMVNSINLEPKRIGIDPWYDVFAFNYETGEFIAPVGQYIIKEVEFGRTNMTRAPQSVLIKALAEAIKTLNSDSTNKVLTDASGRLIAIFGEEDWKVNYDNDPNNDEFNDKVIDSPSENLAIYQELLSNGFNGDLAFLKGRFGYVDGDLLRLAYGAFAGSADKTSIIIVDQVAYLNDFTLDWKSPYVNELSTGSPDEKGRHYYNYTGYTYDREATYKNLYVKIIRLMGENNQITYESLYDAVEWTPDNLLIVYGEPGNASNITGFAKAVNDAVQVLEFIHSSDLIIFSPYFTAESDQDNSPFH